MQNRVLAAITKQPGIHKSELHRSLGFGWGTVAYHLNVLQSKGRIKVHRQGRQVRFFPVGVSPQQMAWFSALRNPVHASILEQLQRNPGMQVRALATAMGMSMDAVRRQLAAMGEDGVVSCSGLRGRRYFAAGHPPTALSHFLAAPPPAPEPRGAPLAAPAPMAPLDSPVRRYDGEASRTRILAAIQAESGIHLSDLTRVTGVSWGNLAHHLRTLEAEGLIVRSVHGSRTCYFLPSVPKADRPWLVARRQEVASRILDVLGRTPGLMVSELARQTGSRASIVDRHLRHLLDERLVEPVDGAGTKFQVFRDLGAGAGVGLDLPTMHA